MDISQLLLDACKTGPLEKVQEIIQGYSMILECDLDIYDRSMATAAQYGHLDILIYMHDHMDATSYIGAFCKACAYEQIHIIQYLMQKISRITMKHAWQCAFVESCKVGNFHIIKWIIENASYMLRESWSDGLIEICKLGKLVAARHILSKCDMSWINWDRTLHAACTSGNVKLAKFILSSHQGFTHIRYALQGACANGDIEMVHFLIYSDHITNLNEVLISSLYAACQGGNIEIVTYCIDRILNLHGTVDRASCLYQAVRHGHLHLFEYLMKGGVFFYRWNEWLEAACQGGHLHMIEYILPHAHPTKECLIEALVGDHLHVIKFLLDHKISITLEDVAEHITPKNVYVLLEMGIPLNELKMVTSINSGIVQELKRLNATRKYRYQMLVECTPLASVLMSLTLNYVGFS